MTLSVPENTKRKHISEKNAVHEHYNYLAVLQLLQAASKDLRGLCYKYRALLVRVQIAYEKIFEHLLTKTATTPSPGLDTNKTLP